MMRCAQHPESEATALLKEGNVLLTCCSWCARQAVESLGLQASLRPMPQPKEAS